MEIIWIETTLYEDYYTTSIYKKFPSFFRFDYGAGWEKKYVQWEDV